MNEILKKIGNKHAKALISISNSISASKVNTIEFSQNVSHLVGYLEFLVSIGEITKADRDILESTLYYERNTNL